MAKPWHKMPQQERLMEPAPQALGAYQDPVAISGRSRGCSRRGTEGSICCSRLRQLPAHVSGDLGWGASRVCSPGWRPRWLCPGAHTYYQLGAALVECRQASSRHGSLPLQFDLKTKTRTALAKSCCCCAPAGFCYTPHHDWYPNVDCTYSIEVQAPSSIDSVNCHPTLWACANP